MKNITLAIDDTVLDGVRQIAALRKTTVNALVRDYLTRLASEDDRVAKAREGLRRLMDKSTLELGPDYRWNREELYEERLLPRHQRPGLRGSGKAG